MGSGVLATAGRRRRCGAGRGRPEAVTIRAALGPTHAPASVPLGAMVDGACGCCAVPASGEDAPSGGTVLADGGSGARYAGMRAGFPSNAWHAPALSLHPAPLHVNRASFCCLLESIS